MKTKLNLLRMLTEQVKVLSAEQLAVLGIRSDDFRQLIGDGLIHRHQVLCREVPKHVVEGDPRFDSSTSDALPLHRLGNLAYEARRDYESQPLKVQTVYTVSASINRSNLPHDLAVSWRFCALAKVGLSENWVGERMLGPGVVPDAMIHTPTGSVAVEIIGSYSKGHLSTKVDAISTPFQLW